MIGCIGNFWPLKDQITLLKALSILIKEKEILNIKIKFVGSGATQKECKDYVRSNHLEGYVNFLSEVDHTELNRFYNSLDLFVLPSYYEAFGCVYTEALQVGVPIIAVEDQGIAEVIHENDKKNYFIKKNDFRMLSEKILFFYKQKNYEINYNLDINLFIKDFLLFINCGTK